MAAGRHSVGTIVGWIEVTREAEEAEEVTSIPVTRVSNV